MPNICLNVAVADQLAYVADELEKATASGQSLDAAVGKLLTKMIKEAKPIIFNGNGYSAEWEKEAAKRKLLNLKNTVDALPELVSKDAIKLFETHKVLNEREVHARYEIMLEQYVKTINVEGQLMVLMANRYILPAALEYQTALAQSVAAGKAAGVVSAESKKLLTDFTKTIDAFRKTTDKLADALDHSGGSAEKHAKYMRDTIVPTMNALREIGDKLETTVPSGLWPLPTYREMLFIK
jgi:glutamine synthetase